MPAGRLRFPKSARVLKSAEFRTIYQEGSKFVGPLFAAFYRRAESGRAPRVGFTTPRAIGKAVVRNRIKRRLREAVRLQMDEMGAGWDVVFNPRRSVLKAEFEQLRAEVARLFGTLRARST